MKHILLLLPLISLIVGCAANEDATERAVMSQAPLSETTGATTKDLNQRQDDDVEGMDQGGLLNSYEEQEMEGAIGNTGN